MNAAVRSELSPFASPSELEEARTMLASGASGRDIAAHFAIAIGRVGEWVARQREAAR